MESKPAIAALWYEPPVKRRTISSWPLAIFAACVSWFGAACCFANVAYAADEYLREVGSWCGTGRLAAATKIEFLTPLLFVLPLAGWWLSRRAEHAVLLCRAAIWASLAAWITALFVVNRW